MTSTHFSGLMNDAASRLVTIEAQVLQETKLNLLQKVAGVWTRADDDLFSAHTAYCFDCWRFGFPDLASRFWENVLTKETAAADAVLQARIPSQRIHKGAPFYNTGHGYLLAGNLDKAIAFISEAGKEEKERGTGSLHDLLLGNHGLTEDAILEPIMNWITESKLSDQYLSITATKLDLNELKSLIAWLCNKPANAIQFVVCLLRLKSLDSVPRNDAVRHIRVQAMADLLLIVESSIRVWQTSPTLTGIQLYGRILDMLPGGTDARSAFGQCEAEYGRQLSPDPITHVAQFDKETPEEVNWIIQDNLGRLASSTSAAQRAGISCHLIARLRNSLMHVIDSSIDLYSDEIKFSTVTALILSVIRLSQGGDDDTISVLPTT